MINPTLLVVVEHCWLYCLFFVVSCTDDKCNLVVSCINDQSNIFVGCS
jgi:hypothetical protein